MLPAPLLARAKHARKILEIGAGTDFTTALALHEAARDATILVSDVDPRVLRAPAPLLPMLLDATRAEDLRALQGVDLVIAVRIPEELQASCFALARRLGADLAMRALKDEWAHVDDPAAARGATWGGGWRYFALRERA